MQPMARILIVEDDQRVAELLRRGLEEFGWQTAAAYDGEMGLRLFRSATPELVICDVVLPRINGFECVKRMKEAQPGVPIIMLTALGSTDDKLDGFDAGADDYMVKPFDIREVDARIRVLLKRTSAPAADERSREVRYADLDADLQTRTIRRAGREIALTPTEFNLLVYMMRNPGRVLSRVEIAEKVWDTHFDTGTNFIDVYINYLRKKIDNGFPTRLIHTKPGMGYMLRSEDEDPS